MAKGRDYFPEPKTDDTANFRKQEGPLAPQPQQLHYGAIGGTYRMSTRIDPETALTGGYQPIDGDVMPPCPGMPYLPKN